jgi:hypothetical protein
MTGWLPTAESAGLSGVGGYAAKGRRADAPIGAAGVAAVAANTLMFLGLISAGEVNQVLLPLLQQLPRGCWDLGTGGCATPLYLSFVIRIDLS